MSLVLENITKVFGDLVVLKDFSMVFEKGNTYAIMGPSGSGKTTLINIIMGLIKADKGKVFADKDVCFSAIFQEDRLCENLDALNNVRLVLDKNISSDYIVGELNAVGIKEAVNKPVSEFSGGMKRRVAIIRALLSKNDILIMDEPFKGLDEELRETVIEYIKKQRKGRTLIMVTHNKADAQALGAQIKLLKDNY